MVISFWQLRDYQDPVWIEIKGSNIPKFQLAAVRSVRANTIEFSNGDCYNAMDYGEKWRCWNGLPTHEEAIKMKWINQMEVVSALRLMVDDSQGYEHDVLEDVIYLIKGAANNG